MTFRALFLRFCPVGATAGKQDAAQVSYDIPSPLWGLRGYRVDNLGGCWQRSHPSRSPTLRRSGSVRAAHPTIPAGGITGHTRPVPQPSWAVCVHSSPTWAGCSHPTLYRTHHPTIQNRDRLSPYIVHCQQGPTISRPSAAGTMEETACLIRNRAETGACVTGRTMPIWTSFL